ncbi:dihydrodipicolinate synthase family protein [Planctomonas sp. JC2975]|uniref:dihydrodipicolinate synthase family protein n=1 Tax=Planctomonas sp. JC2975 TaxID=2729626 RepID=UPI001475A876|nr:dihydrodipicolinate synthase family protein [Planctomonas sp. JC2975]NNC14029.1 dihydrodipicolinate synthase family protein [Planctomonas sp. JC2975]
MSGIVGMVAPVVRGICPVLETPFAADESVDYDSFDRVVEHVVGTGVRSVMFPGFASEFYKLSDAERTRLTERLLARVASIEGFTAVVSVPDHATHLAVKRAVAAVEAGAGAINILPPHQQGPSGAAVRVHIRAIARAVWPVPVIVQYAPAQTGTALDAATIAAIAAEESNLQQVKVESTPPGAFISALLDQTPSLSAVVGYGGVQLIDALRRGAVGAQPGCSFIELYMSIWDAWQRDDHQNAISLHTRLLPYISYWMQSVELIIAAEKRISWRRGLIASDRCRSPLRMLDTEEDAMIERFLLEFSEQLPLPAPEKESP